jgi:hypothetical protein
VGCSSYNQLGYLGLPALLNGYGEETEGRIRMLEEIGAVAV